MRPQSAKAKGRLLQQHVAKRLCALYNLEYTEDGHFNSRGMGQAGVDIQMSPTAKQLCPFDIECKNQKNIAMKDWIKQAEDNTKEGRMPLVVFKIQQKNFEDGTYCTLRFEDLLSLLNTSCDIAIEDAKCLSISNDRRDLR